MGRQLNNVLVSRSVQADDTCGIDIVLYLIIKPAKVKKRYVQSRIALMVIVSLLRALSYVIDNKSQGTLSFQACRGLYWHTIPRFLQPPQTGSTLSQGLKDVFFTH